MRSRLSFMIIAAVLAVTALAVGLVAVAGAEDDADLPEMTASELLARMAAHDQEVRSVSGDIVWRNRLLGDLPVFEGAFEDAGQSPFLRDGSGRFWAQDERVRFDAQTDAGDQLIVADGEAGTVWVYDSVENTAKLYRVEGAGDAAGGDAGPEAQKSPAAPTPDRIAAMLQMAARFMTVEVTGQGVVAGQDAYLLSMTPAAEDTALGSVQAAVDGRTFMPLRVDVTARGGAEPVLTFGFERVSYGAIDDDVFAFTPPDGAQVERETIDPGEFKHDKAGEDDGGAKPSGEEMGREARRALLGLDEARELVEFDLRAADGYEARAFRWAYVFEGGLPLDATGSPLFGDLLRMGDPGDAEGGPSSDRDSAARAGSGPAAVLLYGEGFGAIGLAQTATTPELREQLRQLPAFFEPAPVAGGQARAILTPLGGVVVWEDEGVTLAAFGIVTGQDLTEFVESVR
jgi:outer membrane lipoprotein-sorting protein